MKTKKVKKVIATVKPDLNFVVRVAEHACDDASKRILKPSMYRLQIFLVKDQHLGSLLPHEDKTIACFQANGDQTITCFQANTCDRYDLYGDQA